MDNKNFVKKSPVITFPSKPTTKRLVVQPTYRKCVLKSMDLKKESIIRDNPRDQSLYCDLYCI